jgi:peroxiredoxin
LILTVAAVCSQLGIGQKQIIKPAPDPILEDLSGNTVRISDFQGKVVLVNFWVMSCGPCADQAAMLGKWQTENYQTGLQVVGILLPPINVEDLKRFLRANKIYYPLLQGTKKTKALFDDSNTLPVTVVIDRDGNIAEKITGVIGQNQFDRDIKPLLKTTSPVK